jgi:hypothetical protein
MTFQEEIAAIQDRIAKAESVRDTWRTSGMQEKYLEAYSLVESLELHLERMRQEGLRTFLKNHDPAAAPALSAHEPPSASAVDAPDEREGLMDELSITYNGRHYLYEGYRYDKLEDAVSYARLQEGVYSESDGPRPMLPVEDVETPDESQREIMAALAITFEDGVYHLGEYRYDRLADAVNYARLQQAQES